MNRAALWAIGLLATSGACALVTNLDDLGGGSASDASCDGVNAPCLVGLGAQWQPVAVTLAGCAPGWAPLVLRTSPRPNDAGCACGACVVEIPDGGCTASSAITSGPNCGDPPIAQAAPGQCTPAAGQHIEAHGTTLATTCTAGNDAGKGADSDELDLCVPGCNSNYCGTANRCVMTDGDVACPSGFTLYATAGVAAVQNCPACTCAITTPPACKGTVTAFESPACSDAGLVAAYALDTCNVFSSSASFASVKVDYAPPTSGACSATMTGTGVDASLVGTKTICCE